MITVNSEADSHPVICRHTVLRGRSGLSGAAAIGIEFRQSQGSALAAVRCRTREPDTEGHRLHEIQVRGVGGGPYRRVGG